MARQYIFNSFIAIFLLLSPTSIQLISAPMLTQIVLLPPTNVRATQGDYESKVILQWKESGTFKVYKGDDPNNLSFAKVVDGNIYTDQRFSLKGGKEQYYAVSRIRRVNGKIEEGRKSFIVMGHTIRYAMIATPEIDPVRSLVSFKTNETITLAWSPILGADHYEIHLNDEKRDWTIEDGFANSLEKIVDIKDTTYQFNNLPEGTYYWIVQAVVKEDSIPLIYSYFTEPHYFTVEGNDFSIGDRDNDINLIDFRVNRIVIRNQPIPITIVLQNNSEILERSYQIEYYLSSDGNYDEGDILIDKKIYNVEKRNRDKIIETTIEIETVNGTYYLIAIPRVQGKLSIQKQKSALITIND